MSARDLAIREAITFAIGVSQNFTIGMCDRFPPDERRAAMAKGWENWPKLKRRMDALQNMTPETATIGFERDADLCEVIGL